MPGIGLRCLQVLCRYSTHQTQERISFEGKGRWGRDLQRSSYGRNCYQLWGWTRHGGAQHNFGIWEAEAGGLQIEDNLGQSRMNSETVSRKKKKTNKKTPNPTNQKNGWEKFEFMVWQDGSTGKAFVAKPEEVSSILGIHVVEEKNQLPAVLWHHHGHCGTCVSTYEIHAMKQ